MKCSLPKFARHTRDVYVETKHSNKACPATMHHIKRRRNPGGVCLCPPQIQKLITAVARDSMKRSIRNIFLN